MNIKNNQRLVFFNGEFIPEAEAKISIYDSSLMFGDMVFEMTRSFDKKHFKLEEHIERLFLGLKILRINIGYTEKEIYELCLKTSEKNEHLFKKDDEHRLMIDVTRGILDIYKNNKEIRQGPNLIIADFPLRWTVQGMDKFFYKGINAVITSQRAIPAQYLDPKIKNRSRLFYLMANIEASLFKGDRNWALLLDSNGFIAEGSGDNFLIIKNGKVITPEGREMLRGISRSYVTNELCKELGIEVIEKNIEPYDVYNADEAFVTATPFCMLPVTSLNSVKIGDGKVGKIFNKILSLWGKKNNIDIKQQIISWQSGKEDIKISPYKFAESRK